MRGGHRICACVFLGVATFGCGDCMAFHDPFGLGDDGGDDDDLRHGIVQFEFHRGESQPDNPFVGTTAVAITMQYLECLSTFYDENPALRQEGPEGVAIFGPMTEGGEGWLDRLCDPTLVERAARCEVRRIDQDVEGEQLTVVYDILIDNIEGSR